MPEAYNLDPAPTSRDVLKSFAIIARLLNETTLGDGKHGFQEEQAARSRGGASSASAAGRELVTGILGMLLGNDSGPEQSSSTTSLAFGSLETGRQSALFKTLLNEIVKTPLFKTISEEKGGMHALIWAGALAMYIVEAVHRQYEEAKKKGEEERTQKEALDKKAKEAEQKTKSEETKKQEERSKRERLTKVDESTSQDSIKRVVSILQGVLGQLSPDSSVPSTAAMSDKPSSLNSEAGKVVQDAFAKSAALVKDLDNLRPGEKDAFLAELNRKFLAFKGRVHQDGTLSFS